MSGRVMGEGKMREAVVLLVVLVKGKVRGGGGSWGSVV